MNKIVADWIAADWGTTHLRVWAMGADNTVLARGASPKGMGTLTPDAFEAALLALIGDWLVSDGTTPVIACGMVGARQGWIEARYTRAPSAPLTGTMTRAPTSDPRVAVHIIPGVSQSAPADVMRGEETQVAGYIASHGGDGVACFPGTHSKWVEMQGGKIARFSTFMTGELFSLLTQHSVLRHSTQTQGWDEDGFTRGVESGLSGTALSGQLFTIRARALLEGETPDVGRAFLSGLLIGAEIAATRDLWQDKTVGLIGAQQLSALYGRALDLAGGRWVCVDGDDMTLAGLVQARQILEETA